MKSVAVIITRMVSGGASTVVRQIISAGRDKYKFTLFTGNEDIDSDLIKAMQNLCNIRIIDSLVRNISPYRDFSAYKELCRELSGGGFDIVHTHTSKAGFIGRMAAGRSGVPAIIHSTHGTIYDDGSNIDGVPHFSLGLTMLKAAERYVGKKYTMRLTVLSEREKRICIENRLAASEKIVVIPNGIESRLYHFSEKYRLDSAKKIRMKKDDFTIVSVGRLSSEKGHHVLIDAFSALKKKYCNKKLRLILVGDGPEKKALLAHIEEAGLNVADMAAEQDENVYFNDTADVLFTGYRADIRPYLAVSDLFVLPSYYEGFGIALIEAMAAGIPVVASETGGVPEILSGGDYGVLFPPGCVNSLVSEISYLLEDSARRNSLSQCGRERAKEFTLEKMLNAYYNLYNLCF